MLSAPGHCILLQCRLDASTLESSYQAQRRACTQHGRHIEDFLHIILNVFYPSSTASSMIECHRLQKSAIEELKAQLSQAPPPAETLDNEAPAQAATQLHRELVALLAEVIKTSKVPSTQGCAAKAMVLVLDHMEHTALRGFVISVLARDSDLSAALAQLLQSPDPHASYRALALINSCIKHTQDQAEGPQVIIAKMAPHLAPRLAHIIMHGATPAVTAAVELLAALVVPTAPSRAHQNRALAVLASVASAGAIPALLELLQTDRPLQQLANAVCDTLEAYVTAAGGSLQGALLSSGIMPLLQQLQSHSTCDQQASAYALTALCQRPELCSFLMDHGAAEAMVAVSNGSSDTALQHQLSITFFDITARSSDDKLWRQLEQAGAAEAGAAMSTMSLLLHPLTWWHLHVVRWELLDRLRPPHSVAGKLRQVLHFLVHLVMALVIACSSAVAGLPKEMEAGMLRCHVSIYLPVSFMIKLAVSIWIPSWGLLWLLPRLAWLVWCWGIELALADSKQLQHRPALCVCIGMACYFGGITLLPWLLFGS